MSPQTMDRRDVLAAASVAVAAAALDAGEAAAQTPAGPPMA